jgi:nitrate reductase delta subunit
MTTPAVYAAMARLLDYPSGRATLLKAQAAVSNHLAAHRSANLLAPFFEWAAACSLAELQEEYVGTFDFNPITAPYLGHHLFGENQKKAMFLIGLKQEFRRFGFSPAAHESPDHLPVLFDFMAHVAASENGPSAQPRLSETLLPGLEHLAETLATRQPSHWRPVLDAAVWLCTAGCKEAIPC